MTFKPFAKTPVPYPMTRILTLMVAALCVAHATAQTEGNNVFGPDHILQVDIDFYSPTYWDELLTEYDGEQNYIPAAITIATEVDTTTLDSVGIRLKGNSSMNHPGNKKPFKVDFNRFIPGQAYDLLKKLNFNNGFKDPTFAREKVFLDVCEDAGILAPRATFAEVRYNGEAWGFYTVVEQIDDQFLDRSIGDDDGMLFKAGSNFGPGSSEASLVYEGPDASDYGDAYELKMNESDDWSDFIGFIEFINTASDEQFENEIGDHLDLQAYLRSAALDNLFANLDSYTLSARNYYLYQNTTLGRWQWIKWDCNETFGSYAMGVPGDMTELDVEFDGGNYDRPLLERILANENLKNAYLAEMCELRELYFNSEYLDPHLDAIQALIQSAVYSDDNKMYSNADFAANFDNNLNTGGPGGGGGPGGSLYGLHSFVSERSAFVANEVDCTALNAPESHREPNLAVFPNPASSGIFVQWNDESLHGDMTLFSISGQSVQKWQNVTSGSHLVIDVSEGLYMLRLELGTSFVTEPLQVVR